MMIIYVARRVSLTFPLRKALAATNSLGGMTLLSVSNVLITLDAADGIEMPYEFSARTMNMYDVPGLKSLICKESKENKDNEWKAMKANPFGSEHTHQTKARAEGANHLKYEDKCSSFLSRNVSF
jgi:hypothetical protein